MRAAMAYNSERSEGSPGPFAATCQSLICLPIACFALGLGW